MGVVLVCTGFTWGFFAHEKINNLAVFTLPPDMISFYKKNIQYLTDASVNPDRRRYAVEGEAPRHYIDLDLYEDSISSIPKYWKEAVEKYGVDSLNARGIVPWHITTMYYRLKDAFLLNDPRLILKISAEIGHYTADAHVPLHTTSNYNGQLTGQTGLHAFWESRLPELFFDRYDFFVGRAAYISDVQQAAWDAVGRAHEALDSVLNMEKRLSERSDRKYSFETRGRQTVKLESREYAGEYHRMLNGMVERQMQASVKMIGDLWYTAWVDAGQPDIRQWVKYQPSEAELKERAEELKKWKEKIFNARSHDGEN
jgi:hypothetical protein